MNWSRSAFVCSITMFLFITLFIASSSHRLFPDQPLQANLTSVPIPELEEEIAPEPEIEIHEGVFSPNSTFREVLLRHHFDLSEIERLVQDTAPVYNWNRVMAGRPFRIERLDGSFKEFRYEIDDEEYLTVDYRDDRYMASRHRHEFDVVVEEIYGQVDGSLWNSLVSAGEAPQLVISLIEVLRWDIDFTSVQPGEIFKVILEKKYLGDRFVKYGDLLAVQFTGSNKNFYGFLFTDPETGKPRYYDQTGRSVRKAFLQVPFNFDPRVTSGFSRSRFHPILKQSRPHLGVDYAAPTGTPVLASASGRVVFAGPNGGYGNQVRIRHSNGYTSSYAHLSRIEVRAGQRVSQGDRIGRVGATGLATGPHLDYRIQNEKGVFIDPRKMVSLPSEEQIEQEYRRDFEAVRDRLMQRLEEIPGNRPYINRNSVAG